jgi:hypothetical protein
MCKTQYIRVFESEKVIYEASLYLQCFMSALLIKALHFAVMNVFHTVDLVLVTIWSVTRETREAISVTSHDNFVTD